MRYLIILLLALSSCRMFSSHTEDKDDARIKALEDIQRADMEFSDFSKEHGMRKAFLEYIDDDGVLLRANNMPITGANAIDFLSSLNDSTIQLTWEPRGGEMATSLDMGYTYGVYLMKDSANVQKGTYVTIWKKQKDGKWKFVLDSGNPGVGE